MVARDSGADNARRHTILFDPCFEFFERQIEGPIQHLKFPAEHREIANICDRCFRPDFGEINASSFKNGKHRIITLYRFEPKAPNLIEKRTRRALGIDNAFVASLPYVGRKGSV